MGSAAIKEYFLGFICTKLMTYAREQVLKCSLQNSFVVSFMHLKLREQKEDYTRVGESKARIG